MFHRKTLKPYKCNNGHAFKVEAFKLKRLELFHSETRPVDRCSIIVDLANYSPDELLFWVGEARLKDLGRARYLRFMRSSLSLGKNASEVLFSTSDPTELFAWLSDNGYTEDEGFDDLMNLLL